MVPDRTWHYRITVLPCIVNVNKFLWFSPKNRKFIMLHRIIYGCDWWNCERCTKANSKTRRLPKVAVFCIAVRTFELLHSFHFIRGLTAEHTPWVIVQPRLHICDLLRGNLCKVTAFRKPTADHAVLVFIASTFSGVVRVTVVYCRSGFTAVYRPVSYTHLTLPTKA